ncbi:glycosyltransferase [Vallitalea pronyensis]|uniref:Glycosyltransferase n=1 Tax=Vallitalea pronyensis TaxID=1348613 RepID=A0A8J8SG51_9FIRM|nr:glycosyltransferase [Vallitalea pronyensis]QUI22390.1 glycosyltransferase [Vallitalea pronyensis]
MGNSLLNISKEIKHIINKKGLEALKNITLSCCIIAYNEEKNINQCLDSIKNYVDDIILVDTGSTDNTKNIAKHYNASVYDVKWEQNFSTARNSSIEHSSSDWILVMDCDEYLDSDSVTLLQKLVCDETVEAYYVKIINHLENGRTQTAYNLRLFRNNKGYHYKGRIHEDISDSIIRLSGKDCMKYSEITLYHHGYSSEITDIQAKINRNMAILNTYEDHEKNGFYYYNIASEYFRKQDKKTALHLFQKSIKKTPIDSGYCPMLVKKLIITLLELMQYKDALQQIKYYQHVFKGFNDLYFLEANCHIQCGRYSQASISLDKYIANDGMGAYYPTQTFVKPKELPQFIKQVKDRTIKRSSVTLSICIIVKDDYHLLMKSILSANEIADEIIVLDTKSQDKSDVLANQYGAIVHTYDWSNDYAEAKNNALKHATGDWVLFIDSDEILTQQSQKKLMALLEHPQADAYYLNIITFLDQQMTYNNSLSLYRCRLFKNKTYRFRGCINESIVESIYESGGLIDYARIEILHVHYLRNMDQLHEKRQMKWDVIEHKIDQEVLQLEAKLKEEFFSMNFEAVIDYSEQYFPLINKVSSDTSLFYTIALYQQKQYEKAIHKLRQFRVHYPDYTDLIYLEALCHYGLHDVKNTEILLKKCIEDGEASWKKYTISIGSGSFKAIQSLMVLYKSQNRWDEVIELSMELAKIEYTKQKTLIEIMEYYQKEENIPRMLDLLFHHKLYQVENLLVLFKWLINKDMHKDVTTLVKDVYTRMKNNKDFITQFSTASNHILKNRNT